MDKDKFIHIDRIAGKIKQEASESATYATQLFTSTLNSKKARKERTDALQSLILAILKDSHQAKTGDVLKELKRREGNGVIETVTDDIIEWTASNGRAKTTQISGIKYRICRAKKKLGLR